MQGKGIVPDALAYARALISCTQLQDFTAGFILSNNGKEELIYIIF